ncbi:MAG: 4-demethylwyosine synthase TYW1 [bacterium]
MIPESVRKILKKQHYEIVGDHSAVQICRWTKKSLRDEGVCYKEKFYGIKSHLCCQMTPSLYCPNQCLHCWRAIEFTTGNKIPGKLDSPEKIIDNCIKAQRRLLQGFKIDKNSEKKQLSKANQKKYLEAQEPMQFAISLSGEPTLYFKIGELIIELRKRGKTSFLVTNGLYPKVLKKLSKENRLPTQLYISVNAPNEELFNKLARSSLKDAWKRFNKSLELMGDLKCRTVFRMNLVRNLNMNDEYIKEYVELIKKARSDFIEIKSYMAVGFARNRLGYDRMPTMNEMISFSKKISKVTGYKIEDQDELSRVFLLKRDDSIKRFISKADL